MAGDIFLDGKVQFGQGGPLVEFGFLYLLYHIFFTISIGLLACYWSEFDPRHASAAYFTVGAGYRGIVKS